MVSENGAPPSEDRLAALERENELLRAQVEGLQSEIARRNRVRTRATRLLGGFATRVTLGRPLDASAKEWLREIRRAVRSKSFGEPMIDQTGDLLAAIVRRVIRVGLWAFLLAVIPAGVTIGMLWRQNSLIQEQNATIQGQLELQASTTLIVRRTQLLAAIYDEECDDAVDHEEEACQPTANTRTRAEAVRAFSKIERDRGVRPDLRGANLRGMDLSNTDLRRADLRRADLSEAFLNDVNLDSADLRQANLSGVVSAFRTNLKHADLNGADVSGADLRSAENLTWRQLASTRGDTDTQIWLSAPTPSAPSLNQMLAIRLQRRPDSWVLLSGVDKWNIWRSQKKGVVPDLRAAYLRHADLHGANLRRAVLIHADLQSANLRGADLSGALLTRADFKGADLSGADLGTGGLSYADLITQTLLALDYREADLTSVQTAENLTQGQIDGARGDAKTILPEGLERPRHWVN